MIKVLTCFLLSLLSFVGTGVAQSEMEPATHLFKMVDGIDLKVDVYSPSNRMGPHPVVLYIHGGAMVVGRRQGNPLPQLRDKLLDAGYVVVSTDYRKAPKTKAGESAKDVEAACESAKDVEAACEWLRKEGPELFNIHPDQLIVMGGSAGGYLTLLTGARLDPAPQALVSFSGYGDLLWYVKPTLEPMPEIIPPYEGYGFMDFYHYTRKYGIWIQEVTGLDPAKDSEALKKLRPIKNITASYPPTLFLHATGDASVPCKESIKMKQALDAQGVSTELVTVESGHDYDMIKTNPEILDKVVVFLDKTLGRRPEGHAARFGE